MKAVLLITICILLAGCGGKENSARLNTIEAQNKALAAQVKALTQAVAENTALLAEAKKHGEADADLLKELAARTDEITAAQKRADGDIRLIARRVDEVTTAGRASFNFLNQVTSAQFDNLGDWITKLSAPSSPAVCDFFNPDLSTLKTVNGFHFYVMPVEIKPHDGGTTLTFRIGNPYAAQFINPKFSMTYGIAKPKNTAWANADAAARDAKGDAALDPVYATIEMPTKVNAQQNRHGANR